jgi:hypothetical protein
MSIQQTVWLSIEAECIWCWQTRHISASLQHFSSQAILPQQWSPIFQQIFRCLVFISTHSGLEKQAHLTSVSSSTKSDKVFSYFQNMHHKQDRKSQLSVSMIGGCEFQQ